MANQNLSQFGEKLFVADADHTFIWDSAAAISKRVSRNSWLNSGELTSSAPVTISQTWGTTGTYTAFKVVATETLGANTASNLLELWSGSTPALKLGIGKGGSIISKVGVITPSGTANASGLSLELFFSGCGLGIDNNGSTQFLVNGTAKTRCGLGVVVASDQAIAWSSTTHTGLGVASDTILLRDGAANTLALRNGAAAQTFRVYKTYPTTGADFERFSIDTTQSAILLAYESGGTGSNRDVVLRAKQDLYYDGAIHHFRNTVAGGSQERLTITSAGNVGIGTTAPSTKLDVVGLFQVSDGTTGKRGLISSIDSVSAYISPSFWGPGGTYVPLHLQTSALTRLAIDTAGNVGIGTTSPTSKLDVAGAVTAAGYFTATSGGVSLVANGLWQQGTGHLTLASGAILGWSGQANVNIDQPGDTRLQRDEAYHLALRNGTNGQKFSVYGTYPGAAWERFTITAPTSGNVLLGTYKGTGGIARGLEFQTDGVSRWSISTAGHLLPAAGNTYNIGASGGNSPSNIYASNNVVVGGNLFASSIVASSALGPIKLIDASGSDFGRLQFGGTTASYPALKRSSITLQARLADDSAFAPIQGKLTTDTAFDATVVTPTGFITLYDSTGAAYKVPCVPA